MTIAVLVTKTEPALPTRRGRPSPLQSEAITRAIIAAASDLFLQNGFDDTSMEAVALRSGIPKTTLYRRYANKRDLLWAVWRSRSADWSKVMNWDDVDQIPGLQARLTRYMAMLMYFATHTEVRAYTLLIDSAFAGQGDISKREDFFAYRAMLDRLEDVITTLGPAEGIIARQPRKIAETVLAVITGWLQSRDHLRQVSEAEAMREASFFIGLLFQGRAGW